MKKSTILSIFIAAVMSLLLACNSNKNADKILTDDNQRKEIITAISHSNPYMIEMMQEMMNSDNSKQMMMQNIMSNNDMMNMMMDSIMSMSSKDSLMFKNMMNKTMEMSDADRSRFQMMMGAMQSHPDLIKSMNGMYDMNMKPKNGQMMEMNKK